MEVGLRWDDREVGHVQDHTTREVEAILEVVAVQGTPVEVVLDLTRTNIPKMIDTLIRDLAVDVLEVEGNAQLTLNI